MALAEYEGSRMMAYDLAFIRYSGPGYEPLRLALADMDEFEAQETIFDMHDRIHESTFYNLEVVPFIDDAAGDDFALLEDLTIAFDAGVTDALLGRDYSISLN